MEDKQLQVAYDVYLSDTYIWFLINLITIDVNHIFNVFEKVSASEVNSGLVGGAVHDNFDIYLDSNLF